MDNFLSESLEYASNGFKVFPLIPKQKRPIKDWSYLKATNDQEEVFDIFNNKQVYNIGLNLKESSLIVLDLDRHKEGQDGVKWLSNKANESIENDCVITTPRNGLHIVYALNGFEVASNLELADGVEILTGFCTAVPSYVEIPSENVKGSYELVSGSFKDIKPIPQWLINEIQAKQGKSSYKAEYSNRNNGKKKYTAQFLEKVITGIDDGGRDEWLKDIIGTPLAQNMDVNLAYEFIHIVNQTCIRPPMEDSQVNKIFKSILGRERKKGVAK